CSIALDGPRLPLAMALAGYQFGSLGPLHDAFLEGFAAVGNRVATVPGLPPGSPWEPGGLGFPLPNLRTVPTVPDRSEVRGGARLVFSSGDVTYTLAHYYTYLDVPGILFRLLGSVQLPVEPVPTIVARVGYVIQACLRFQ